MFCGFLSNHIDIAPSYAGTLMALTNTAATIPGIIVPLFVAHMTHGNVSKLAKLLPRHLESNPQIVIAANDWRLANHFLRHNCSVYNRNGCIHTVWIRRGATVEQIASPWADQRQQHQSEWNQCRDYTIEGTRIESRREFTFYCAIPIFVQTRPYSWKFHHIVIFIQAFKCVFISVWLIATHWTNEQI